MYSCDDCRQLAYQAMFISIDHIERHTSLAHLTVSGGARTTVSLSVEPPYALGGSQ